MNDPDFYTNLFIILPFLWRVGRHNHALAFKTIISFRDRFPFANHFGLPCRADQETIIMIGLNRRRHSEGLSCIKKKLGNRFAVLPFPSLPCPASLLKADGEGSTDPSGGGEPREFHGRGKTGEGVSQGRTRVGGVIETNWDGEGDGARVITSNTV